MHTKRDGSLPWGILQLTRVGIGVAISFSPLIRGGLLIEVVLRLHQRERLCEEGATAYRLVVPKTAVTAALLRAIRQVKRDAPLRLEPRAQNRASDVSALLCLLKLFTCSHFLFVHWVEQACLLAVWHTGHWSILQCGISSSEEFKRYETFVRKALMTWRVQFQFQKTVNKWRIPGLFWLRPSYWWKGSKNMVNTVTFHCTIKHAN